MYICHCNRLTDDAIDTAITKGATCPRAVYAGCGCRAECGGCTRTILGMLRGNGVSVAAPERPPA